MADEPTRGEHYWRPCERRNDISDLEPPLVHGHHTGYQWNCAPNRTEEAAEENSRKTIPPKKKTGPCHTVPMPVKRPFIDNTRPSKAA
jgi:hypothetical protein